MKDKWVRVMAAAMIVLMMGHPMEVLGEEFVEAPQLVDEVEVLPPPETEEKDAAVAPVEATVEQPEAIEECSADEEADVQKAEDANAIDAEMSEENANAAAVEIPVEVETEEEQDGTEASVQALELYGEALPEAQEEASDEAGSETTDDTASQASDIAAAEEAEPFSGSLRIECESAEILLPGDRVTFRALDVSANRSFTIHWESRKQGADWRYICSGDTCIIRVDEATEESAFRAVLVSDEEKADRIPSEEIQLTVSILEVEEVLEPVEATARESEEAEVNFDEALLEEIADYQTPLAGPQMEMHSAQKAETDIQRHELPVVLGDGIPMTLSEANVRVDADGLSEIFLTLPEGAELDVMGVEGDWVMVRIGDEADAQIGYIFIGDVQGVEIEAEEAQTEEDAEADPTVGKKVTIFSSRRTSMRVGETVTLTSRIEGFEDCEEIRYQWECDRGAGFETIEGADGDSWSFTADARTLEWNWRLTVLFR